jgi:raffinose/stachyose/melibiose transport system permease protein
LVFLLPPLALFVAGVLLPIGQSLFLSFFSWDGISARRFVGLANYHRMFSGDDVFRTAFVNSLVYLVICVVIQLGAGLFVANLLLTLSRGRELVKTLYLLPAVISTVAIAFLFQRIYSTTPEGMLNVLLRWVGLGHFQQPWLSNVHTVLPAVSIPEGWRFSGLYMVILYAALLAVPREIEEAALIDGATGWQTFRLIRFPSIRPVWITCLILAVTYGLRGFDVPYLLTNGGPGQASELLTTYMYKTAFTSTDFGYASTISVFIVVQCLVAIGLIGLVTRRRTA